MCYFVRLPRRRELLGQKLPWESRRGIFGQREGWPSRFSIVENHRKGDHILSQPEESVKLRRRENQMRRRRLPWFDQSVRRRQRSHAAAWLVGPEIALNPKMLGSRESAPAVWPGHL